MKLVTLSAVLLALATAPACVLDAEDNAPESLAAGGGHGDCQPSAVMMSGDFDGDGTVTVADLEEIEARKDAGDYAAFFDMNADGKLDGRDVAVVAGNLGDTSHPRDVQIAQAWADTEQYRNVQVALSKGWAPFTQALAGHGIHFADFSRVMRWQVAPGFRPGEPEGLNYGTDGHLAAVFYYSPGAYDLSSADPSIPARTVVMEIPATEGFAGHHDHWHNHVGACFNGLGTANPDFDQCVVGTECEADLWSAKFHMLHLWMYDYNPCGAFAGTNPHLTPDAPPEPHHMECTIDEVVDTVLPYGSL